MQGFNKANSLKYIYYPPDYDWRQGKGLNKLQGTHALGNRARKLDKGILIVRFELPYNIWCESCNAHVGQGVRFNAEKKRVGNYYSTPIWSFKMKCHLCSGLFEIQTDPKNTEYIVISGAKRKNEEWDSSEVGIVRSKDDLDDDLKNDPFYKIEKSVTDINKAKESVPLLSRLYKLNEKQWADPYTVSSRLRKIFREEKKILKMEKEKDEEFRRLNSLSIKLAKEDPQDYLRAKLVDFKSQEKNLIETTKKEIHSLPFFAPKASPVSIHHTSDKQNIVRQLKINTRIKKDPFIFQNNSTEHNHIKLNANNLKQMLLMTNHKSDGPQGLVSYKSDDSE
ncbi:uncharacterized protein T551_01353 [Pneumocystis jirovecii RU7]|uniref:Coiled-coil domain-containing protein 130 n=1 Tax=Pneumocystis jirovecii (strain RU7) TaxID=1408657 RepID=A0A0W4ZSC0_PNEJ7|nr:uncharacterized protein T551_01353 [Pneumocystis jirovecii RU7]KTW31281.1 hypothetical protein T551_01353 [Pneumocystis jirovecii RU7]